MKLQNSEILYESLFENMIDGLAYCQMIFDTQGHPVDFIYLEVNKNFEKLTGLKNAPGKKVTDLIPGIYTSNPDLFEIYGRVSLTGKPEKFETYIEPLSRWFLVSVYSPRKNFFVAVFQNITDAKLVLKDLEDAKIAARNVLEDIQIDKELLARANAKDEAILTSIGESIIVTDEKGKITRVNKVFEILMGWKASEVVGKNMFEFIPKYDENDVLIPEYKRSLSIVLAGKTKSRSVSTLKKTHYYLRKDKSKIPIVGVVTPIILNTKIVGAVQVFRDVLKEKDFEEMREDFLNIAAHDLRTPATIIKDYISRILDGEAGVISDKAKWMLKEAYIGNDRAIRLISDFLSVSRLERGKVKIDSKKLDLTKVVETAVKELQNEIEKKGLTLEYKKIKLPEVLADSEKTLQVINNLITNAIKFTLKGSITISHEVKTDKVITHITDTGIGIDKDFQKHLFEKFSRKSEETGSVGLGLGLYICKMIIDGSIGEIWVKSKIGKGSTFSFSLPIAD
jgi:PAS domain S-box-containing protein